MKKFDSKKRSGFTLIELLVSMGIVSIFIGGTVSAYMTFNKSQTIESDARQLMGELAKVRSLAANLVYPPGCATLSGYNVKNSAQLTGIIVTAKCGSGDISSTIEVLKNSKIFSPIPLNITFSAGNGFLTTGTDLQIKISDAKDVSVKKTITVSGYGSIFLSVVNWVDQLTRRIFV